MPSTSPDASWQAQRAKENLEAGKALLRAASMNPAATRLYYALYHTSWLLLARGNHDPSEARRDGHKHWPHDHLKDNVVKILQGVDDPLALEKFRQDLQTNLKRFLQHRVNADYKACGVNGVLLASHLPELEKLISDLLAA